MNEKYKARLDKLKSKAKQHGPNIVISLVAGVVAGLAVHYRNQRDELADKVIDPYNTFVIPEPLMDQMREGKTLMYRVLKTDDGEEEQYTFNGWD